MVDNCQAQIQEKIGILAVRVISFVVWKSVWCFWQLSRKRRTKLESSSHQEKSLIKSPTLGWYHKRWHSKSNGESKAKHALLRVQPSSQLSRWPISILNTDIGLKWSKMGVVIGTCSKTNENLFWGRITT